MTGVRCNLRSCPMFDIEASTEENYRISRPTKEDDENDDSSGGGVGEEMMGDNREDGDAMLFYGPFAHIRAKLDYTYHAHYKRDRQIFQDSIISSLLGVDPAYYEEEHGSDNDGSSSAQETNGAGGKPPSSSTGERKRKEVCTTPTHPWIVFTAGSPGAGKRHTVYELVKHDRFPLLSFVYVDTDEIRRHFPEYLAYAKRNPAKAGKFTRKEAGYIGEIVVRAALDLGKNVIVDGVVKDVPWYRDYFSLLRREYPKLRIGLMHVVAPQEEVKRRAMLRCEETLRCIPEDVLESMAEQVALCVAELFPSADFFCEIRNAGVDLELLTPEGEDWASFRSRWVQTCAWLAEGGKSSRRAITNSGASDAEEEKTSATESMSSTEGGSAFGGGCCRVDYSGTDSSSSLEEEMKSAVEATLARPMLRKDRTLSFSLLRSTEDNYRSNDMKFYGPYAHLRAKLDYSYHSNYTCERQCLQDAIMEKLLQDVEIVDVNGDVCTTPTEPWCIFTAGAMGAGKGYTVKQLVDKGRFPILGFVSVDPDEVRRHLPEFLFYSSLAPDKAGALTNKECGYVSEILTLVALEAGKNVLIDGSLRDSDWYQMYFKQLRSDYPKLKLGILHVTAPREAVFERAQSRALKTGRTVPREVLEGALDQVPRSVGILAPLTDYWCEIRNSPESEDVELINEGEKEGYSGEGRDWDTFKSQWFQLCAWIPGGEQKRKQRFGGRRQIPSSLRAH